MNLGLINLKKYIFILFCACCLLAGNLHAQDAGAAGGQAVQSSPTPQSLPAQLPAGVTVESLTPAQRQAVQAEMSKTGGQLTPEAVEALKKSPEFKDLKPEDVAKGKEVLEKKQETEKEEGKKVDEKADNKGSPFSIDTYLLLRHWRFLQNWNHLAMTSLQA